MKVNDCAHDQRQEHCYVAVIAEVSQHDARFWLKDGSITSWIIAEYYISQLYRKGMCSIANSLLFLIFVRVRDEVIYFISTDAVLLCSSLFLLLYPLSNSYLLQVLVHRLHKEPVI